MLSGYNSQLTSLTSKIEKDTKKIQKVENKLKVATQGYRIILSKLAAGDSTDASNRAPKLNHPLMETLNKSICELECFQKLEEAEQSRNIPMRLAEAKQLALKAEEIEQNLQSLYAETLRAGASTHGDVVA